jgi:2-polyprenyl-3-methyl-5-hydroxy-6-metoxy-1,4-benzoquinol methylase
MPTDGDYRDAFYAAYARTHTVPRKGQLTRERLEKLRRTWQVHFSDLLPASKSARILDAGCGDGALLWWLQQLGYPASGVEVSGEQVAIAKSLGVEDIAEAELGAYLVERPATFDVIVVRNVLEHFPKDELIEILQRIVTALKPGGRMIAQVPNGQSPFAGRIRYGDFTHELAFTESSLGQLLTVLGLDAVRCRPVPPVFSGPVGLFRWVWWLAVQSFYKSLLAAEIGTWSRVVTLDIIVSADKRA